MSYQDSTARLTSFRAQIEGIREKMREIQAAIEPQPVADYTFETPDGQRRLSELFEGRRDLFVIHNMGRACAYCTLWADGFNGLYPHIADRAAFVVTSPDAPEMQQRFAGERGWRFPMASHRGSSFAADMGYRSEAGGWLPGVSVFRRDDTQVLRVSDTAFGPNDDFCAVWSFLDLLPGGGAGCQPKFHYT